MLRLLLVALPLVVASPAAVDAQEIDALQFKVQFPQFEVRSPPESRPLRPAARRDQHDSPATHTTPHARHPPTAHITMDAPRHYNSGKTIHPMIYFVINLFRAQGYQPTIRRCAPQPGRPPRMRRSFGQPCRCAREAGAHAAERTCARPCVRTRAVRFRACPTPRSPRRACLGAMPLALAIGTCERAASPVLLKACALLPGAGSRGCVQSGSTATAPSTSPPRPAGATSTPRSSSRLRPVGATLDPLTIECGPIDSGAWSSAPRPPKQTSTPAPSLATGPPHHRLSHDASPHSPV